MSDTHSNRDNPDPTLPLFAMNETSVYFSQGQHDIRTASSPSALASPLQTVVHPCLIEGRPHIIYPHGLKQRSPALFQRLHRFFSQQGYSLREDRRAGPDLRYHKERRRWAPLLLVTASLFFSAVSAQPLVPEEHDAPSAQQKIHLQLIYHQGLHQSLNRESSPHPVEPVSTRHSLETGLPSRVFHILSQHYAPQESDPAHTVDDLKQIARYYAEFPQIITLLDALADKHWQLVFNETDWYTTATGSAVEVRSATIHFNTRSAAQLRLNNGCRHSPVCIASPADAMLHELLHAHSMLVETRQFLAQGGMSSMLYPYQHEYAIIDSERRLYASMSRQDAIRRPQRREHTGRLVRARCPTCID